MEVMKAHGVRPSTHSVLHYGEAIENHGIIPDSSTGEFAHQQHKRGNKSSSGRDPPEHYIRCANTLYAFSALANDIPYEVITYDRRAGEHRIAVVRPGPKYVRAFQQLMERPGGVVGAPDQRAAGNPTPAQLAGQHQGAAVWEARLLTDADLPDEVGDWEACVSKDRFRPHEHVLLKAYETFYFCNRNPASNPPCAGSRCPRCWTNSATLKMDIHCSRFGHGAPLRASSGLGRWRGGDVRSVGTGQRGDSDAWALGEGCGEDVEMWQMHPFSDGDGPIDVNRLTMGRILYFFEHEANAHVDATLNSPTTSWVLVFDLATAGRGNARQVDRTTEHPVLNLRGRGRPLIYPAAAIRRHVHLYHICPSAHECGGQGDGGGSDGLADGEWICGLERDEKASRPSSGAETCRTIQASFAGEWCRPLSP